MTMPAMMPPLLTCSPALDGGGCGGGEGGGDGGGGAGGWEGGGDLRHGEGDDQSEAGPYQPTNSDGESAARAKGGREGRDTARQDADNGKRHREIGEPTEPAVQVLGIAKFR